MAHKLLDASGDLLREVAMTSRRLRPLGIVSLVIAGVAALGVSPMMSTFF
ncbi:MAG: hypothetical protein ACRDTN_06080 [Mycobacterium sp.]